MYVFDNVVAMVTKPKGKIIFVDDIFPILSHIWNTENLLILSLHEGLVPKGFKLKLNKCGIINLTPDWYLWVSHDRNFLEVKTIKVKSFQ